MIDGQPTRDMSALTATRLLRGAAGSKVTLVVIRQNAADPHEILSRAPRRRQRRPTSSRSSRSMAARRRPEVRPTFESRASARASSRRSRTGFATLQKDGATGAVIDLRGTADGAIEDGIAAARLFVKSGTLAIRAGREPNGHRSRPDRATAPSRCRWCCSSRTARRMPRKYLRRRSAGTAAPSSSASPRRHRGRTETGQAPRGLRSVAHDDPLPARRRQRPIHERGVRPTVGVEIPTVGFDEVAPTTRRPAHKGRRAPEAEVTLYWPAGVTRRMRRQNIPGT